MAVFSCLSVYWFYVSLGLSPVSEAWFLAHNRLLPTAFALNIGNYNHGKL